MARKPEEGGGVGESLSRAQLCARFGIDRSTLWRRIKAGRFPNADMVVNGRPAWSTQALSAWERPEGFTRAQICAQLGIDRTTLWRWLKAGRFPGADLAIDGRPAWSARAVTEWRRAEAEWLEAEEMRKLDELYRQFLAQEEIIRQQLAAGEEARRRSREWRARFQRKTALEYAAESYDQVDWANP
ncbi:helix-turn-helix domain-containing protein [Pelagibius sp. CAU 1746]|uniref:helix-turn-helix transcriptional regulator n=1 Tax=Pelagibius sp. CAU 1746 TaxID=3140370 RepID=UPI00325C24D8